MKVAEGVQNVGARKLQLLNSQVERHLGRHHRVVLQLIQPVRRQTVFLRLDRGFVGAGGP